MTEDRLSGNLRYDAAADKPTRSAHAFGGPPNMTVCLTLDLEPDFGRRVPSAYTAWNADNIERLIAHLAKCNVPLTVFVVAESLIAMPDVVERFRKTGAEFHLHSYSHDLDRPDAIDEIQRGKEVFERHFGYSPAGYRAPEGRISPQGWHALEREGFTFDASIFPSFWPRPRYLQYARRPFRVCNGRLVVVPAATLSPARLIVSVSWLKLLGWPLYRWLLARAESPDPFLFGMHLHDLWATRSASQLGAPWTWVYRRNNDDGFDMLVRFLNFMQARGERFETVGTVVSRIMAGDVAC